MQIYSRDNNEKNRDREQVGKMKIQCVGCGYMDRDKKKRE